MIIFQYFYIKQFLMKQAKELNAIHLQWLTSLTKPMQPAKKTVKRNATRRKNLPLKHSSQALPAWLNDLLGPVQAPVINILIISFNQRQVKQMLNSTNSSSARKSTGRAGKRY